MKEALRLLRPELSLYGARLVLVIHDEVLVEVPLVHAEVVQAIVAEKMTEGMSTFVKSVPIEVDADIRATWAGE